MTAAPGLTMRQVNVPPVAVCLAVAITWATGQLPPAPEGVISRLMESQHTVFPNFIQDNRRRNKNT